MAAPGTDANPGLNTQVPLPAGKAGQAPPAPNASAPTEPVAGSGTPAPKPERWRRLEALFYACSEMDSQSWPAFLALACGDDIALRQEVESLMASAEQPADFLRKPVQNVAQEVASGASAPARRRLGSYQLLSLIGEGGMGEVWLATRADNQFERQVAIKLMGPAFVTNPHLLPRFRSERQILANLDHPNIARLLDGGITPEGAPYLVMEHVQGLEIDAYCTREKLPLKARLYLFRTVCAAVEYAHQNLVVHRDIKPANILVTGRGVPKLLDFGIAKLMNPDGPGEVTRATQRLMTLEYASPEQIRGRPITTASDVFALGVLLYELVAGRRPFGVRAESRFDIAREVCEQEPDPPTAVAKANLDSAPPDARTAAGELEEIIRKAMSKDPAARYESVSHLSDDVGAFLAGYPIAAHNGNWRYAAAKFTARHKKTVAAAALATLAVIGFGAGMAVWAHRANQERLIAGREAKFLEDMFKSATPEVTHGHAVTARELLDMGAKQVDRDLASVPEARASLLASIAEAYQSLGLIPEAEGMAERALALKNDVLGSSSPAIADTLFLVANLTRLNGEYAKAEPLFRNLVELRRKSAGENGLLYAHALSALGECLYLQSKDAEAEPLLRRALAIDRSHGPDYGDDVRNYLALLLERKGEYQEAFSLLTAAVDIDRRTVGVENPDYAVSLHNLASVYIDLGDLSGAESKLRDTLAIRRKVLGSDNPALAYTLNNLGYVLLEKGQWQEGAPFLHEAIELNTRRLGENHPLLAGNLNNWARLLDAKGDYAESRKYFERALDTLRRANNFPGWTASAILLNMGILEFDARNYTAAETFARQSLEMRRTLGGEETPAIASSLIEVAEDQLFQGYPRGAEPLLRQALAIRKKKYGAKHPAVISAQTRLGEALIAEGEASQAEPLLREALSSARTAPFPLLPWQVAEVESALSACLSALHRTAEAESLAQTSNTPLQQHVRRAFREPAATRLHRQPS